MTDFFEKYSNIKFHQIWPTAAEMFHEDGQIAMANLTVVFRKFCERD